MAVKRSTLQEISDKIIEDYLCFNPASNSTKPPHIANGIFRCVSAETCDSRDVHKWMNGEAGKRSTGAGGKNRPLTAQEIISDYENMLQEGNRESPDNIKRFRSFLKLLLNPDNTVYPDYDFSVTTITSHWDIKGSIQAEGRIGEFIYGILSYEIDGKVSKALPLILNALKDDSDDISELKKPIIPFDKEIIHRDVERYQGKLAPKWDSCKISIRRGFDNLADNLEAMGEVGNSLLVLRRIVCFAGFATFLYLCHVNHAIFDGFTPPALIDGGTGLISIEKASEQSYTTSKRSVETFYVNAIYQILLLDDTLGTHEQCVSWISNISESDEIKQAVLSYYESFQAEEYDSRMALARALQVAVYTFAYKNNSPSDFCRVLGVRSGIVGPKGNRATKRFIYNSFSLETLVLSMLTKEELFDGVDLRELSTRSQTMYHIIIGGDVDTEYKLLTEANIAQATPGDLRGDLSVNARAISDTLISLGLGKRYADGVTLIGRRL